MLDKNRIPTHIAIIMDGNGRWAQEHGLRRTAGHREGIKRVREIVKACAELQVKILTLFVFSTENWKRPKREINTLMNYLEDFLEKEVAELNRNNMRFIVIGEDAPLSMNIQKKIKQAQNDTRDNTGMTLVLALNYGSRREIVEAAKRFALDVVKGIEKLEALTPEKMSAYLYTAGLPDPDLLIRTSGEMRISNFLLWQLAYSELYFTKKYWPEFRTSDLEAAIIEFQGRKRRFGGIDDTEENN
ncbi:MAG: isoprenyl transferase [Candidatus Omnitrophica bacterium]|nr:isoprenyl transferase [Candidatus Omnitrophota bacterium]